MIAVFLLIFIFSIIAPYNSSSKFGNDFHAQVLVKRKVNQVICNQLNNFIEFLEKKVSSNDNSNKTIDSDLVLLREIELDQITTESDENKNLYDIDNRITLQNVYVEKTFIDKFNLLNFRTISKHDSGVFTNLIIIYSIMNTIKINDNFGNLLYYHEFEHEINDIYTFNNYDENFIYITTNNNTIFRKFKFDNRRFDHRRRMNHPIQVKEEKFVSLIKGTKEGRKMTQISYKDGEVNNYEITSNYYRNLKKIKFELTELTNITFEGETILKVFHNTNKGDRIFILETDKNFRIFTDDFQSIKNFTKTELFRSINKTGINEEINYSIFLDFFGFYFKNIISINQIDTLVSVLYCKFSDIIVGYKFDTINNLLYVLFQNSRLEIFRPKPSPKNKEMNYCHSVNKFKLNYIRPGQIYEIEIIRKDLIINTDKVLIFFDMTKAEDLSTTHIKYIHKTYENHFNEQNYKNFIRKNEIKSNLVYQKNQNGNYLLFKSCKYENMVVLLNIFNPNSKLTAGNDSGLSIKVPVIFISIIMIVFYQYHRKKNELPVDAEERMRMKNEMIDQIKRISKNSGNNDENFDESD